MHHVLQDLNDLPRVVVGNLGHPAGSDAAGAVHQHHRDDGHVPDWLYFLIVVLEVLEQRVVVWVEDESCQRTVIKLSINNTSQLIKLITFN